MTCHEVEPLLGAFLDGELPGEDMRMVARHLVACAGCEAASARLERAQGALRDVVAGAVGEPDADAFWSELAPRLADRTNLVRRWLQVLLPGGGEEPSARPALWWGGAAVAVALALVLTVRAAWWGGGSPGPDVPQIARFSRIDSLETGNVRVWNKPESGTLIIWVDDQGLGTERLD